ncbi:hypothetical protein OIE66_12640 [Nonomuraea sp. NBC_01738]|uniref:hypothetical protein n=1 Tax=Nonomuraea sp. NBC_01738 TaxID=2976003 RepID=UPI002E148E8D|nr:hypothetical protein OIE66_12640 [Nonomuraea sp. NBC_01738]
MSYLVATLVAAGLIAAPAQPGRQEDFTRAAREFGVPVSVLLGVSYLSSRWDTNSGEPSVGGGFGPMHLIDAVAAPAGDHVDADPRGDASRPMRHVQAPPAAPPSPT